MGKTKAKTSSGKTNRRKSGPSRPRKKKNPEQNAVQIDPKHALVSAINGLGYDGDFFVRNLEASVEAKAKRAKPPRRIRHFHYCTWAHALMRKEVGPEDSEYSYPEEVLAFIRHIVPGNIKGEIREDAYKVSMEEFCSSLDLTRLDQH